MNKPARISEEDRQFIIALLRETKDDFVRVFKEIAKDDTKKGKRKFVSYWYNLAELAFVQPEEEEKRLLKKGCLPNRDMKGGEV